MGENLKDKCAIVGIGFSEFGKRVPKSTMTLTLEGCKQAIEDAGLAKEIHEVHVSASRVASRPEMCALPAHITTHALLCGQSTKDASRGRGVRPPGWEPAADRLGAREPPVRISYPV